MNYKISYLDAAGSLVVKADGRMNADDYISMAKDLLKHPRCLAGINVIFEHTGLEFAGVSADDLQKIRAFHMQNEERIGNGKSAIVVKAGMSLEWHKLWSSGEKIKTANIVRVFENYEDALKWIKEPA